MAEITLTKDNFNEEVILSDKPVLVDFWASWCGPCMMLAPSVEELAEKNADTLKVGKVNVDEQPELARRFRILSIPTLMVFENGKVKASAVGYMDKGELEAFIK